MFSTHDLDFVYGTLTHVAIGRSGIRIMQQSVATHLYVPAILTCTRIIGCVHRARIMLLSVDPHLHVHTHILIAAPRGADSKGSALQKELIKP